MLRHLPLQRQNRYVKTKYLRSLQAATEIPGVTLLQSQMARATRTHLALLDDALTTEAVQAVRDPLFVCQAVQDPAKAIWLDPVSLIRFGQAQTIMDALADRDPDAFALLPPFPEPRAALVNHLRPESWRDPRAWTFPVYGRAKRVCLAAMVRGPRGNVENHPVAFAPCSGRLFYVAQALASARCGLVWDRYLDHIEALVLYNP